MTILVVLATAAALAVPSPFVRPGRQAPPDLEAQPCGENGRATQFHAAPVKPVDTTFRPRAACWFPKPVKMPDGRLANGVAIQAWPDGSVVRIRTALLIPKSPDSPSKFDEHTLAPLADFDVRVGESRRLDEMKKLGAVPMTIRAYPPGHIKH